FPGLGAMGTQQRNRLEWKTLLLNQFCHVGHDGREHRLFTLRPGKENQIRRSRLRSLPWPLDRKGFDAVKRPSHRLHDRISPQQISSFARRGQIQCQDTVRRKMGAQLCKELLRSQVKRDHVSGKRIDPHKIVRPFRGIQEDSGIPNVHMVLGRRMIREIFLGHSNDYGIELNDIQLKFRPLMGEPLCQRSTSVTEDQTSFWFFHQRERRDHQLTIGKKQGDRIRLPHDRVVGPIQNQVAKQVVIANSYLLVWAVFLIDRRRQHLDREPGAGPQPYNAEDEYSYHQRPCRRPLDQPPETKPCLNSAEPRDKRLAADPRQKEERRPPRSRQAPYGRKRDHPTSMPAEILKIRHRQSQQGRQYTAQTKCRRTQKQRRRDTGSPP